MGTSFSLVRQYFEALSDLRMRALGVRWLKRKIPSHPLHPPRFFYPLPHINQPFLPLSLAAELSWLNNSAQAHTPRPCDDLLDRNQYINPRLIVVANYVNFSVRLLSGCLAFQKNGLAVCFRPIILCSCSLTVNLSL